MFETLQALPADAILKLIAEFNDDDNPRKVDLGVGVYRDESGNTPILATVKDAERRIIEEQTTKSYLGSGGDPAFNDAIQALIFGNTGADGARIATLQTPGGSGALRVAAGVVLRARPDATLWVSDPTWNNHVPLLGGAGVKLDTYPYYDADDKTVRFDQMLAALEAAPAGDMVLLHGCCHNPTGMDLSREQWQRVIELLGERQLMPFIDIAYQGFATGIEDDAWPVRRAFEALPEMIVASSCSKNFALYRDRIGSLSLVARSADTAAILRSQAHNIVRTMYSLPPDHGSAIVTRILGDPSLRERWDGEVETMRTRLSSMRELLVGALAERVPDRDFSHITRANGLFSFLGLTEDQVERLKRDYSIYMVSSSRINVAGITPDNVGYIAESVAEMLGD